MSHTPDAAVADRLVEKARTARRNAYCPYSRFAVGAALLAESGRIYTGANCENAAFGAGICAERAALSAAVTAGERRFLLLAVAAGDKPVTPCGICRQFLCEFMEPDAPVYTVARNGDYMVKTFAEIMPFAFTSFKKD